MSYRHTIQAGLESLHEIEQLLNDFPEKGNIPSIELDLVLQKIRNFYEILLMLRQQQDDSASQQPQEQVTSVSPGTEKPLADEKIQDTNHKETELKNTKQEKEAKILSDRFGSSTSLYDSIHDTVVQKSGESIGQAKPVVSIAAAIGINDRYTFIRELFNSDVSGFEETIRVLDEAANFNEAYNYMIQHFDWDMDSETVQLLLDLIRRKYITGKHE